MDSIDSPGPQIRFELWLHSYNYPACMLIFAPSVQQNVVELVSHR